MTISRQALKIIEECRTCEVVPRRRVMLMMDALPYFERRDSGDHMIWRGPDGLRLVIAYNDRTKNIDSFRLKDVRNILDELEKKEIIPVKTLKFSNLNDPGLHQAITQQADPDSEGKTLTAIQDHLVEMDIRLTEKLDLALAGLRILHNAVLEIPSGGGTAPVKIQTKEDIKAARVDRLNKAADFRTQAKVAAIKAVMSKYPELKTDGQIAAMAGIGVGTVKGYRVKGLI